MVLGLSMPALQRFHLQIFYHGARNYDLLVQVSLSTDCSLNFLIGAALQLPDSWLGWRVSCCALDNDHLQLLWSHLVKRGITTPMRQKEFGELATWIH